MNAVRIARSGAFLLVATATLCSTGALAEPAFSLFGPATQIAAIRQPVEPSSIADETTEISADLQRQVVNYPTSFAAGTVVIDTAQTYLYYVLGDGKAIRYGIGVGRDGFTWSGTQAVTRKAEWPDWTPPQEMIARQPYLPRWMAGGDRQPARRPRHLSRQHDLPDSRHQHAGDDRPHGFRAAASAC